MAKTFRRIFLCLCILATFLIGFLSGSGRLYVPKELFSVSLCPEVVQAYGRKIVELMYEVPIRDILEQVETFLETMLN